MEPPECPVCLQSYDGGLTVPRVLACGHTVCEECLNKLPKKFPDTIRCPACTVLVKFPPQGPSALPKNIDLLRLFPSSSRITPEPGRNSRKPVEFFTRSWSDDFYAAWKDRILLHDAVSMESEGGDAGSSSRLCGWLKDGSTVSLLRIASFKHDDCDSALKYSYVQRMMNCLWGISEEERDELDRIISVTRRGISKVFGLWGDLKNGALYLVGLKLTESFWEEFDNLSEDDTSCFAIIAMQIMESLLNLHKEGIFTGCLSVSCVKFDEFENVYVDLVELIETGRDVSRVIAEETSSFSKPVGTHGMGLILIRLLQKGIFMSSEVLFELLKEHGVLKENNANSKYMVSYSSDVWPVCCLLLKLLLGKRFPEELIESVKRVDPEGPEEGIEDLLASYTCSLKNLSTIIESELGGKFTPVIKILCQCCCLDPQARPPLTDLWKCIREMVMPLRSGSMTGLSKASSGERKDLGLVLGDLCLRVEVGSKELEEEFPNDSEVDEGNLDTEFVERLSKGKVKSKDMRGHQDCLTGLAVGGGFLFSCSFDKNILLWSLKDFSLVHTFKGHQDKVMALVYIEGAEPVCVSGDGGGGIFVWSTTSPLTEQPLRKWYEPKDWRYTGIHALAYSEHGHVYSGSGDNTIKAWSLQDGSLVCTMTGHKSVVSALVVQNGVLYSGSWDGTVRLWSLSDHSFLTVLGDETQGIGRSVLSLAADNQTLVAAYQNGDIQIWRDDELMKSMQQVQSGAILSVAVNGKWLFTGGWDKIISVQELSGDEISLESTKVGSIPGSSVITSLLYWEGKIFSGFADATIKVYYSGG